MKTTSAITSTILGICSAAVMVAGGIAFISEVVFANRVPPGTTINQHSLTGLNQADLQRKLHSYQADLGHHTIEFKLRGRSVQHSLAELGITLNQNDTLQALKHAHLTRLFSSQRHVEPVLALDPYQLKSTLTQDFSEQLDPPQNASLTINANHTLTTIPSSPGETINTTDILQQIADIISGRRATGHINLTVHITPAEVQEPEIATARAFTEQLVTDGLTFTFEDQTFTMSPTQLASRLTFVEQVDPTEPSNHILGVSLEPSSIEEYLHTTVVPVIDRPARNARFKVSYAGTDQPHSSPTNLLSPTDLRGARVEQFAVPEPGQAVNIPDTITTTMSQLAHQQAVVPLAVTITAPDVGDLADIERLGLNNLLAIGESDYDGSPKNRAHNINVGASRYDGLLIPPEQEFSFNEFLGPVSAEAGYKPELVIKNNVTTPEYGGGLCQVSTSLFRAALNAGLEITRRRNHSYAVRYYGTPGLDATIYPPYTDLRFRNNTPNYILIQTRIQGTKLAFEFWGTDDGRQVTVTEPTTYARQANGAVKAHVTQSVTRNGETVIEETFHSNYKSPKLFPKVVAANGG